MVALTAIAGAIKLAEMTGLTSWIAEKTGFKSSEKVASVITGLAGTLTGETSVQGMISKISADQELVAKLRQSMLDNEQEIKMAYYADLADARDMYKTTTHEMADKIADRIITWNIWAAGALALANLAVLYYITNPTIAVAAGNVLGGSIAYLWNERATVLTFYFGSSKGSKDKTAKMT